MQLHEENYIQDQELQASVASHPELQLSNSYEHQS
jgi:hypothetical protein